MPTRYVRGHVENCLKSRVFKGFLMFFRQTRTKRALGGHDLFPPEAGMKCQITRTATEMFDRFDTDLRAHEMTSIQ